MVPLRAIDPAELHAASPLWALNQRHAAELSSLAPEAMAALARQAFLALAAGEADGFLIALDQSATYDSPNFLWFRARLPRFVYVDRVAVAAPARGRGVARALYARVFDAARAAGHGAVVCEVNVDPPNPTSDAFHAALGFVAMGEAALPDRGRTVGYLRRDL